MATFRSSTLNVVTSAP